MQRYSENISNESTDRTNEGTVTAVTRALLIMEAFRIGERHVTLAELSRRTGLHNTTVLRLARTLAQAGYMVQRLSLIHI